MKVNVKSSFFLTGMFYFLCFIPAQSQETVHYRHPIPFQPETYKCTLTTATIEVDGYLNEPEWENTPWTKDFVDIEGALKPKPPLQTRVKMLWDTNYFYIAAELEEPHVWATLHQRDTIIFQDDDFEVFIDPNEGDTHQYYEFEINAYNTVWDLLMIRPYRERTTPLRVNLYNWNIPDWKTAVQIKGTINQPSDTDEGWIVEMAIPWSALRELADGKRRPAPGESWRVNFSRVDWHMDIVEGRYQKQTDPKTGKQRREENWVWSPQGYVNMHRPESWGYVQFVDPDIPLSDKDNHIRYERQIRWAMQQLYLQQLICIEQNGQFCTDLNSLTIPQLSIPGYEFRPKLYTTPSLFEVIAPGLDGNERWHIRQDGLVWKSGTE